MADKVCSWCIRPHFHRRIDHVEFGAGAEICYNTIMIAVDYVETLDRADLGLISLVTGEDEGQYAYLKQRLLERIGFDSSDLTYSYFDMAETPYEQVEMDLESLPFFDEGKWVILDNCHDVTTSKKAYLDDKALKRFEAYLEKPSPTTRLMIFAPGKLDSKRRIVKLLKRDAQLFETNPLKEADLRTYFQRQATGLGLTLEASVFDRLIAKSNGDFSEMSKNLAFLKAYKASGLITEQDIDEAIPRSLMDNIFELTKLILQRKSDACRDLVRDLRLQGQDDIKLIAVMLGQFRLFLQVNLLASQGRTESQMVADLSDLMGRKVNPYQVKFALRDSRSLSMPFLKQCLTILIDTDYQIKTGVFEKDYLLDLAILKMIGLLQTTAKG